MRAIQRLSVIGCAMSVLGWTATASAFHLTSPAFEHEQTIPTEHTCDGADVSPPLVWGEPPPGTQSFVLLMDDPDAPLGRWTHWLMYNLSPRTTTIDGALRPEPALPDGAFQGANDFRRLGYGGPCPPPGRLHRYTLTLYALDVVLPLPAKAATARVLAAMEGHVLARVTLAGLYERAR